MKQVSKEEFAILTKYGVPGEIRYFAQVNLRGYANRLVDRVGGLVEVEPVAVPKPSRRRIKYPATGNRAQNQPIRLTFKATHAKPGTFVEGSVREKVFMSAVKLLASGPMGRGTLANAISEDTGLNKKTYVHSTLAALTRMGYLTKRAGGSGEPESETSKGNGSEPAIKGETDPLLKLGHSQHVRWGKRDGSKARQIAGALEEIFHGNMLTQIPRHLIVQKVIEKTGFPINTVQPVLSNMIAGGWLRTERNPSPVTGW